MNAYVICAFFRQWILSPLALLDGIRMFLWLLLLLSSQMGGVGRKWEERKAVEHCEVLNWMGEWVGGVARGLTGRFGGGDSRL